MLTLRSEREIDRMRAPGRLVAEAHEIAAKMINPGVTTAAVDKAVEAFFESRGAAPLFKGVPGPTPFPCVTCISVNEEVVHGIPSDRILKEGDIVSIDTGCKIGGWCGDAAVTHAVGQIDAKAQALLDATREVLRLALKWCGEEKRWSDVSGKMDDFVRQAGFSVVDAFAGHGIGRELHEPPSVPNHRIRNPSPSNDFELQPGLVIAVEPMVNMGVKEVRRLPDGWTQVTVDGLPSAHFEHTIAFTKHGPEPLTVVSSSSRTE